MLLIVKTRSDVDATLLKRIRMLDGIVSVAVEDEEYNERADLVVWVDNIEASPDDIENLLYGTKGVKKVVLK